MKNNVLKTFFTNCFTTLSLNIIALAVVSVILKASSILSSTVFELFITHLLIHAARVFINFLNIKNGFLELAAHFSSVPVWICILIVIFVYIAGCIFYITTTNKDIDFINAKLRLRNQKEENNH